MAGASITVRTDEKLKAEATALFADLGMDMTTAINVFLNAAVKARGIPFAVTAEPDAAYRAWMRKELAKSWEAAQNPDTPRLGHEEFWRKLEGE